MIVKGIKWKYINVYKRYKKYINVYLHGTKGNKMEEFKYIINNFIFSGITNLRRVIDIT